MGNVDKWLLIDGKIVYDVTDMSYILLLWTPISLLFIISLYYL